MSTISARIRDRYDRFCDYFADHAFGSRPPDLTVLSLLPPVDRCLILERVLEFGCCDFPTCIDKLSMAYYKTGMDEVAFEFVDRCEACGWLRGPWNAAFFRDKLANLVVEGVSTSYGAALAKLPRYDTGSEFCGLLREFCLEHDGDELLDGSETEDDLVAFVCERRGFVQRMTRSRAREAAVPSESSGAGMGFALANTQVLAFSYLLGGARIANFKFATSESLGQADSCVREVWEETEPLVRRFSPYPYSARRDAGERAYLVSVEFPCRGAWRYQYRTSRQFIDIRDVVDLMFEVMDVKPREKRLLYDNGEKVVRFSWMFLEGDVARLMDIFPGVAYRYGAWVQMQAVFHDMDRILNQLARRAVGVYPFMNCEFTGW